MFDQKIIKTPFVRNGEKKRWKNWALKMRGYIGGVNPTLLKMMEVVEKYPGAVTTYEGWNEEQVKCDQALYAMLT